MRYRTKPFEIEAVQFKKPYVDALYDILTTFTDCRMQGEGTRNVEVYDYLQDTWVKVNDRDYIIRGMKGEYYPCAAEVFEAKYEAADEDD